LKPNVQPEMKDPDEEKPA